MFALVIALAACGALLVAARLSDASKSSPSVLRAIPPDASPYRSYAPLVAGPDGASSASIQTPAAASPSPALTPVPSPSPTATPVPSPSPTATPVPSPSPTATPSTPARGPYAKAEQVIVPGKQYTATLRTDRGDIVIRLFPVDSPRTVNSFVFLAQNGYVDNTVFHRAVKGLFIQGVDPDGAAGRGPGYVTEEDRNELKNLRGFVSMAKDGRATTFGGQFIINLRDNSPLDGDAANWKRYFPFGQVLEGMEIADAIGNSQVGGAGAPADRPVRPVIILGITISAQ